MRFVRGRFRRIAVGVGDVPPLLRWRGGRSSGLTSVWIFTPGLTLAWPQERRFRRTDGGVATGTSIPPNWRRRGHRNVDSAELAAAWPQERRFRRTDGGVATGTSIPGKFATQTLIPGNRRRREGAFRGIVVGVRGRSSGLTAAWQQFPGHCVRVVAFLGTRPHQRGGKNPPTLDTTQDT